MGRDFDKLIESPREKRRRQSGDKTGHNERSRSRHRRTSPRAADSEREAIARFTGELDTALESRPEFDRFSRREVALTAKLMFRYGIASLGELKNTKARNRVSS